MTFDGTDLSLAYGSPTDHGFADSGSFAQQQGGGHGYDDPSHQKQPTMAMGSLPPPALPPQGHMEPVYAPPPQMYAQQPGAAALQKNYASMSESFFEKMAGKRGEVLKLVVLSLVILFAISIDKVATFYYNNYITTAFLTSTQELIVRISYPIIVILVLWSMKAM